MGGPIAGRAAARPPRVSGHAPSDPRTYLHLSSRPLGSYQLTPPNLMSARRSQIYLLRPDEVLHLDPVPAASPRLRLENPYPDLMNGSTFRWKFVAPAGELLTSEEIDKKIKGDDNGVRPGLDLSLDPGTFSLSLVARDWNFKTFKRGWFLADVLHEPTASLQFGFNPPGSFNPEALPTGYGPATVALSMTALNLHFQRGGEEFFELALGQFGVQVDATGKMSFPFSVQGELHDVFAPHVSLFVSAGGSLTPENGKWKAEWTPPVAGLLWHWWNP